MPFDDVCCCILCSRFTDTRSRRNGRWMANGAISGSDQVLPMSLEKATQLGYPALRLSRITQASFLPSSSRTRAPSAKR